MGVFGDLNEVNIIGNVTNDLELRRTSSGTAVLNFGVATNRNYQVEGEWKEETTFHNIVVWGSDAEQLEKRARKGTRIFVSGRLQTRSWEGQDGKTNYKTEVVSTNISLLNRYETGPSDQLSGGGGASSSGGSAPKSQSSSSNETIDPDDLPF